MRQWTETRPGALWDVCGRDAGYSAPLLRCLWGRVSTGRSTARSIVRTARKSRFISSSPARRWTDPHRPSSSSYTGSNTEGRSTPARELGILACGAFADRRLAIARDENMAARPRAPALGMGARPPVQPSRGDRPRRRKGREWPANGQSLKRVRRTLTQTRLSRKQRMENLKGAFAIRKPPFRAKATVDHLTDTPGVILVDDVFTTGSTVDECAKSSRKAGARRVAAHRHAWLMTWEEQNLSLASPTPPEQPLRNHPKRGCSSVVRAGDS